MSARFIFATAMVAVAHSGMAQSQQKVNIDAATVFLSGAELTSSVKLTMVRGENEFLLTNVAGNVNSSSLSLTATGDVVLESATFQNNYLVSDNLSPAAKLLTDSIENENARLDLLQNKLATITYQLQIIKDNSKVSGNANGLSVSELQKMLNLVNSKMEALFNKQTEVENQVKKVTDYVSRLNKQLEEEQKKQFQPGGQLLVKFYAKEATTSSVTLQYTVPNAGWTPVYDISATDINSPIKLAYKANIYQNTGVSWHSVKLSLSTGNPTEGAEAPILYPWFMALYDLNTQFDGYKNKLLSKSEFEKLPTRDVNDVGSLSPGVYQNSQGGGLSIDRHVSVDNSGINTTFDIDLPYTIPSDGEKHLVGIKDYTVPATYRYYAVPKLDKDAFLEARITNWQDLNLLPGQTNIFYENTFVGQGALDVRNVQDTMTISLGRDKKIVIKRERDTKMRSVKANGSTVKETYAYNISVRNTRKDNINLTVLDQMPISTDKDIQVLDEEVTESDYNDTTGIITWNVPLKPNETKNLSFGYTLKYPKDKTIASQTTNDYLENKKNAIYSPGPARMKAR
jgi:uncharacterized protein (TIGR02231 family)